MYRMYKSRRRWSCENLCISLFIRGFHELKPRIHASSNGDRRVWFSVKENSEMAQEQEHRFRGSISITTNDCIVGIVSAYSLVFVILMLKWWWHDTWFLMMNEPWLLFDEEYLLFSHMDEMQVLWFRDKITWMIAWHIFSIEEVVLVW